jgi:PST family polysaccharide transporter
LTPNFLRYTPRIFRSKIEHRTGLLKIIDNISWLFLDQILRMGIGLLVGVWVARYLGPEQFGLLNYALAFTGLFGALATLGLPEIMVRDLVMHPEDARLTLGTGFVLRLLGGLVAFLLVLGVISYLRPDDTLAKIIVAILGLTMIINASEVVSYWFESRVESKYAVWIRNGVFLVISLVKVGMVLLHASLMAFVLAAFTEALLVSGLLLALYSWKEGHLTVWRPSLGRAKELLHDSWPLILSGLAISVFMKIDQIMLGQMIGDRSVGIYSAAVKISEIWYFIPGAIVSSFFPTIIEAKLKSEDLYYRRLQMLFDLLIWLAIFVSVFMTFFSDWVVNLLYGSQYSDAGSLLKVHIWTGIAVSFGLVWSKWILIENKLKMIIVFHLIAMIINILYNFYFIPTQGVMGAAIATAFASLTAQSIGILFYKRKIALRFLLKSLIPIHLIINK